MFYQGRHIRRMADRDDMVARVMWAVAQNGWLAILIMGSLWLGSH